MMLDATISLDFGGFRLREVALAVDSGNTVAVLGPNGAGKTTALKALAGLAALTSGSIRLGGAVLDDPAAGVFVPPEERAVGVVFQEHLLFPHLDVQENVAFGPRARGMRRRAARRRADEWLARLGLSGLATARPRSLSGGQSPRVALARSRAAEPQLLLLDEPFAALDASARPELRRSLRRDLAAFAGVVVLVTHEPLDALSLAGALLVLVDGEVVQEGTPADVRERPRSRYVADFVGLNLFRGRAEPDGLTLDSGTRLMAAERGVTGDAFAVVHPHAVAIHRARPEGTPRNVFEGMVRHIDPEGARARVTVAGALPITAEVTARAVAELGLTEGAPVWISVKATEIDVFAA